jgi:hypothetical protein
MPACLPIDIARVRAAHFRARSDPHAAVHTAGGLLHGVLPAFGAQERRKPRLTLMVGWWDTDVTHVRAECTEEDWPHACMPTPSGQQAKWFRALCQARRKETGADTNATAVSPRLVQPVWEELTPLSSGPSVVSSSATSTGDGRMRPDSEGVQFVGRYFLMDRNSIDSEVAGAVSSGRQLPQKSTHA